MVGDSEMASNQQKQTSKIVSVSTDTLKEQLNKAYDGRGHNSKLMTNDQRQGLFEYLWDLKEKALMEHSKSVEVPSNWLEELSENAQSRRSN